MKIRFLIPAISLLFITAAASAQNIKDRQVQQLEKAIERYERLKNREEWTPIVLKDKPVLRLRDTSDALPAIKDRLALLGDLRRARFADVYSERLEKAVKQFQLRHGLEDDGIIGPAFMRAINMPLDARINQLKINRNRIPPDTVRFSGTRIVANIPEYRLYIFEDNNEVLSMDIVVGKAGNPTVAFSDSLEYIVFSPYWNVPQSIVRNEILPQISKNSSYLKRNNMEITGRANGLPVIRQKPGPQNSLGLVKFLFPNKYSIYFHDTPSKSLFQRKDRAFSHGCIRLSKPFEMAQYLLRDRPEWPDEAIRNAMNAGAEKWVSLNKPVPVSIIYYTAWIDREGLINFRDDIYGLDRKSAISISNAP